jgi:DNA repair photolyase
VLFKVTYNEIKAKSALNKLKRKIPYGWDLNIYRGCQHGCRYCYALYSHQYLGSEQFSREIFIKTNVVELLEKELRAPGWKGEVINIGGVTDTYQPAEAEYKLMPQVLKLLIKYKNPAIISTKSDLVLRDYDLIDQLSRLTYINIAATITTVDELVREKIEPGAVPADRRFFMLKEFKKTKASIGLHVMPIIPLLTDSQANLKGLFSGARNCGVDYLLPGTLYLRGKTRTAFLSLLLKSILIKSLRCRLFIKQVLPIKVIKPSFTRL